MFRALKKNFSPKSIKLDYLEILIKVFSSTFHMRSNNEFLINKATIVYSIFFLNKILKRMLDEQILKSIECAIAHKCPKDADDSKRCAHCEIGHSFIACEPITLECGHHICKECDKDIENGSLKCKFCAKSVKLFGGPGIAADSLFQVLANDLTKELRVKYSTAMHLYDSN